MHFKYINILTFRGDILICIGQPKPPNHAPPVMVLLITSAHPSAWQLVICTNEKPAFFKDVICTQRS